MINKKRECIFDHEGFLYVCNFETMTMWVIQEEDDEDPVTTLEITRDDHGQWFYRMKDSEAPYQRDPDTDLVRKLERRYEQFLNTMIIGSRRDGGNQANLPSKVPTQRVRKVARFDAR